MKSSRAVFVSIAAVMILAAGCWANGDHDSEVGQGGDNTKQPPTKKLDAGKKPLSPPKPIPGKDSGVNKQPQAKKDLATKTPPPPKKKDAAVKPPPPPPPKKDSGVTKPPLPKATHYKVAAVQYTSGRAAQVKGACTSSTTPDVCALKHLIGIAKGAGAAFVVLPEYGMAKDQKYYESAPKVGSNPGTDAKWPAHLLTKIFSKEASKQKVYLVINLLTFTGAKPNTKKHNTNIAFTPGGSVAAVHHKFKLFGNETKSLTPGNSVVTFGTPLGPMGLLVCADIYGSTSLLQQLAYTKKARVVAFTAYWTVSNSVNWQTNYAKKYGVYLVAANTISSPGMGGGIYDPTGKPLVQKVAGTPSVLVAKIPVK